MQRRLANCSVTFFLLFFLFVHTNKRGFFFLGASVDSLFWFWFLFLSTLKLATVIWRVLGLGAMHLKIYVYMYVCICLLYK